jgi:hypothetical protein
MPLRTGQSVGSATYRQDKAKRRRGALAAARAVASRATKTTGPGGSAGGYRNVVADGQTPAKTSGPGGPAGSYPARGERALNAPLKARQPNLAGRTVVGREKDGQSEAQLGGHADLGRQLQGRVASGAIDLEQAQHTAQERATLEKAYGANWRHHVYGDRGYIKRTRAALAENPNDPQVKALYEALLTQRSEALERARKKLGRG